jgi:hypothetical protein
MTCQELVDLLQAHFARELPHDLSRALVDHADGCACCRNLVATYGLTIKLAATVARQAVPPGVAARVRAAVLREAG